MSNNGEIPMGKGVLLTPNARGYRNNNFLNIEYNVINQWKGLDGSDGRFCKFITPEYGIRAGMKLLSNYIKNGHNTIEKIVNRWAPKSENPNNVNYINHVVKVSGISPTVPLVSSFDTLRLIFIGMSQFESTYTPTFEELEVAYKML